MGIINKNMALNQMRSYASVFSTSAFAKLLKHDDYSFMNSNIAKYDKALLGNRLNVYYDYIKYAYSQLRKNYRNEYIYKNTWINELLLLHYGVKDTVVLSEFRVGASIADIVMFNGTSKAFEIKTELDSERRLSGQLSDYAKLFKESYIVTHESLLDKYCKENSSAGIIGLFSSNRTLKMEEVRKPQENTAISSDIIMSSIRTNEYKNIVKEYYGSLPEMNSFNMFNICKILMEQIPVEVLHELLIKELKKRKTNIVELNLYYKELRQLVLAMKLNYTTYQKLLLKLNQPIRI